MSVKMDRLGSSFVMAISEIIHGEIKDKKVKSITITDVKITNDLSFATVYFTSYYKDRDNLIKDVNKASSFIRSRLCEKIKIRKMPEIRFVYDESFEYGLKIDNIIERINNDREDL